jgi:hypothetical protein
VSTTPTVYEWAGACRPSSGGSARGVDIPRERRLRFVTLLSSAADRAELPADPEFRAAIPALIHQRDRRSSEPPVTIGPNWSGGRPRLLATRVFRRASVSRERGRLAEPPDD